MRALCLSLVSSLLLTACGARTGLEVGDRIVRDAGPPPPCAPRTPELLAEVRAALHAVDGDRLWVSGLAGLGVGHLDARTGEATVLATDHLGARSMAARDGEAWWAHAGFSDFAGALLRVDRGGAVHVLERGLFQPAGVHLDGDWVYYAEWTNSGSLRDEMRGRVLRIPTEGGSVEELATGLGLPTDTVLAGDHVYWVDRRRSHVARVLKDGGPVEVVVPDVGLATAISAHGNGVFFATAGAAGVELMRFDILTGAIATVAAVPTEVRGIDAIREGVLLSLWYGRDRVGNALAFVPAGRDDVIEIDPDGTGPAVGPRLLYWSRTSTRAGFEPAVFRVCREYLSEL